MRSPFQTQMEGRPRRPELLVGAIFTLVWLIAIISYAIGWFSMFSATDGAAPVRYLDVLLFAMAAVLPPLLVWLGVGLLARAGEVQAESQRLAGILRRQDQAQSSLQAARVRPAGSDRDTAELRDRLQSLTQQVQQVETALVALLNAHMAAGTPLGAAARAADDDPARAGDHRQGAGQGLGNSGEGQGAGQGDGSRDVGDTSASQPGLPLGEAARREGPPEWGELIHALNFPTDEKDRDGFRALRIAMKHRNTSLCLRASEDIMNLLAQDGIYMDDLKPKVASADQWRRFANGERGPELADVGGIEEPATMALVRGRMRNDTIFRDAALHFQRRFDIVLRDFCREGEDRHIEALANTRTGRAFMLLGRVSGMFG